MSGQEKKEQKGESTTGKKTKPGGGKHRGKRATQWHEKLGMPWGLTRKRLRRRSGARGNGRNGL